MNEPDTSCEWDGHELCGTTIQVNSQLRIALKICSQARTSWLKVVNDLGI